MNKPPTHHSRPKIEIPRVFSEVDPFYSKLISEAGPTPAGVEWPDARRQTIRFRELCRLFPSGGAKFRVLDYGCGYGALASYLHVNGFLCDYYGFDISAKMIEMARRLNPQLQGHFQNVLAADETFDYVVLSGVFNRKEGADDEAWTDGVWNTIDVMNRLSEKGFAFNILSSWRETERKQKFLYYGDPADFLRKVWAYSPNVALLHDYDLWDFTVLVRKDVPYIKDERGYWQRK